MTDFPLQPWQTRLLDELADHRGERVMLSHRAARRYGKVEALATVAAFELIHGREFTVLGNDPEQRRTIMRRAREIAAAIDAFLDGGRT